MTEEQKPPDIGPFPVADLPPNAVLTMKQFGEAMNVGYDAVARGVRCGEIPAHRIGGAIRIFWGEAIKESATVERWRRK